jgi:hypothetical protein
MSVYTDMEESIMDCWTVVDDLQAMAGNEEQVASSLLLAFAEVYAFKFSRLAGLHEDALKEYYTLKMQGQDVVDSFDESIEEGSKVAW